MRNFLQALAVLSLIYLVIGLIQPRLMVSKGIVPTRWRITGIGLVACCIFFAIAEMMPKPQRETNLQSLQLDDINYLLQRRLQPDMIVFFPNSGLACLSEDVLREAMNSYRFDNRDRLRELMTINTGNGESECKRIRADGRWRILSIEPSLDAMEISGENEKLVHGWWAAPSAAEIVGLPDSPQPIAPPPGSVAKTVLSQN